MKSFCATLALETHEKVEIVDITSRVEEQLRQSGIRDGLLTVYTRHTTTAVRINEQEPRLQKDMLQLLASVASPQASYLHDIETADGRRNAWGHLISLLLGSSETIPVTDGTWALGRWQTLFFLELDGPRPQREVLVHVIGQ